MTYYRSTAAEMTFAQEDAYDAYMGDAYATYLAAHAAEYADCDPADNDGSEIAMTFDQWSTSAQAADARDQWFHGYAAPWS